MLVRFVVAQKKLQCMKRVNAPGTGPRFEQSSRVHSCGNVGRTTVAGRQRLLPLITLRLKGSNSGVRGVSGMLTILGSHARWIGGPWCGGFHCSLCMQCALRWAFELVCFLAQLVSPKVSALGGGLLRHSIADPEIE